MRIRRATRKDARLVASFVHELARFEHARPETVHFTAQTARRDAFGRKPIIHALIAEKDDKPAGMALYYYYYSTWQAKRGIYLEDLYVRPKYRGNGIGRVLLGHLASLAMKEDCFGVRWEVLDWNKNAFRFYKRLGAHFRENWIIMQVEGNALERLAKSNSTCRAR